MSHINLTLIIPADILTSTSTSQKELDKMKVALIFNKIPVCLSQTSLTQHTKSIFLPEEAEAFRKKQLDTLDEEIKRNGSYVEWYKALSGFRKYIAQKYSLFKFGQHCRYRVQTTESGNIVDYHIISYFAPLDFKRIG